MPSQRSRSTSFFQLSVTRRNSLFIPPQKFRYNIGGAHEYIYLNNGFSPHRSSVSECKAIALITGIRRIGIGNCVLLECACANRMVEILRRRLAFISPTRWMRSDLPWIFCRSVFGTCAVIIADFREQARRDRDFTYGAINLVLISQRSLHSTTKMIYKSLSACFLEGFYITSASTWLLYSERDEQIYIKIN